MKQFIGILILLVSMASCSPAPGTNSDSSSAASIEDLQQQALKGVSDIKGIPTLMTNGSGNWEVTLTWTQVSDELVYTIKRTVKTGDYNPCDSQDLSCDVGTYPDIKSGVVIQNLKPGTTQYFKVIVTSRTDTSIPAVESTEYMIKIPLDTYTVKPGPFEMKVIAGEGQATISWKDAERASFYVIQRGLTSGSYPTVVKSLAKSPYVDKNLSNNKTYYYIVVAVNSVGSTNATTEGVATPLASPGDFGAVTIVAGDQSAALSWGPSEGAVSYNVKRSLSETGPFDSVQDPATSPFTDTGLSNGTKYYYLVSALNANGTIRSAAVVNATPSAPSLPAAFTASATAGNGKVTLSWTNSAGATSYTIQYGTSSGSYPSTMSNVTSPTDVSSLTNGSPYFFRVVALNAGGSTNASEVSATPSASGWVGIKMLGAPNGEYTQGTGIALDSAGNVYVSGVTTGNFDGNTLEGGSGNNDYFLAKFDSSGTKQWSKQHGLVNTRTDSNLIATGTSNKLFITGTTQGALDGSAFTGVRDTYVSRYLDLGTSASRDATFDPLIGVPNTASNQGEGKTEVVGMTTIPSAGVVYVTGTANEQLDPSHPPFSGDSLNSSLEFFIYKYAEDGTKLWSTQSGTQINNTADGGGAAIAANDSSLYIAGMAQQSVFEAAFISGANTAGFITKYNSSGASTSGIKDWTIMFGESGTQTKPFGIAMSSNNLYSVGYTGSSLNGETAVANNNVFIVQYDFDGNAGWTRLLGASTTYEFTEARNIVTDANGNIYIAGSTEGSLPGNTLAGYSDAFVAKYAADGTRLWVKQFGVANTGARAMNLALDSSANVYVVGFIEGGAFPGNTLTGGMDMFLAKFDTDGNLQ